MADHSLLPPRGIFVPTHMIFNQQLPAAVLVTWIQLRCLAWAGWATPPLSIPELASLTGIHPDRLNKHLSQLEDLSTLVCRLAVNGKIIVSFPEELTATPETHTEARNNVNDKLFSPMDQASPDHPSYFPDQILGYLTLQDDLDGPSEDDITGRYLWEAEAAVTQPSEAESVHLDHQNCDFELNRKLRSQASQLNPPGSHAYP